MGEEDYRKFSAKLMPTVPEKSVIGIRVPLLRKYAKSLDDYEAFLEALPHTYFEENNLHKIRRSAYFVFVYLKCLFVDGIANG